ncbi:DUF6088 family protein [Pseudomonas sp. s4]|uniref:DUF6088 family protein n=1 Tax=Pseudomonas sp. s4 TaxID=353218 RepID=UPI00398CD28D
MILERSRALPDGTVLSPKEFLHLGSRAAVDQAFSRLARGGMLSRVARGIYVRTAKGVQEAAPTLEKVVKSMAVKGKAAIVLGGAKAAELFGLTSPQQDGQEFLTSGQTRQLRIGGEVALLRHAPRWMLAMAGSLAGNAIRALAWFGPQKADEAARHLRTRMSEMEWEALSSIRGRLPSWMAIAIGRASIAQEVQ